MALVSVDILSRIGSAPSPASAPATPITSSTPAPFFSLGLPINTATAATPIAGSSPRSRRKGRKASKKQRRLKSTTTTLVQVGKWCWWLGTVAISATLGVSLDRFLRSYYSPKAQADASASLDVHIQRLDLDGVDALDGEDQDRLAVGERLGRMARARRVAAFREERILALGDKRRH